MVFIAIFLARKGGNRKRSPNYEELSMVAPLLVVCLKPLLKKMENDAFA